MQGPVALIYLALFFSVSRGQDDQNQGNQQIEDCMDLSLALHPNPQSITLWNSVFTPCQCYCYGMGNDYQDFYEMMDRTDGMACSRWTYDNDQSPTMCLNKQCQPVAEIDACAGVMEDLFSMDVDGCVMTCNGLNETKTVMKETASKCYSKTNPWRETQCNDYGLCLPTREYVDAAGDEKVADVTTANEVCQGKGTVNTTVYPLNYPDYCEFYCYEADPNPFAAIFAFSNGHSCGDGQECNGGGCQPKEKIEECASLIGEDVQDMVSVECQMQCVGSRKMAVIDMPDNSTCLKAFDWFQLPGHCTDNTCIVDPEFQDWISKK